MSGLDLDIEPTASETANLWFSRARKEAADGLDNGQSLYFAKDNADKAGGLTAAGIDEKEFAELARTGSINAANKWFSRARKEAADGLDNAQSLHFAKDDADKVGGLTAAGIDEKEYAELARTGSVNAAKNWFSSARKEAADGLDNGQSLYFAKDNADKVGGLTAAGIDEKEYAELARTGHVNAAKDLFSQAGTQNKSGLTKEQLLGFARDHIEKAGGLAVVGITAEQWIAVDGKPYAAVAKSSLGTPKATGTTAEA